jgi:hypothetical protein
MPPKITPQTVVSCVTKGLVYRGKLEAFSVKALCAAAPWDPNTYILRINGSKFNPNTIVHMTIEAFRGFVASPWANAGPTAVADSIGDFTAYWMFDTLPSSNLLVTALSDDGVMGACHITSPTT